MSSAVGSERGGTSRGRRRRREDDLSYSNLPEVEVYYTEDGRVEMFKKDGYLICQKRTPGDVILPSHLDYFRPYKSGFRKVPTSRPPSPPPSPPIESYYSEAEMGKIYSPQDLVNSEAALEYYNKKHGVDYELVDPVKSNACCHPDGLWVHCNFTAKPRGASQGSDGDEDPTKLFFAERWKKAGGADDFVVTTCQMLDGRKTTKGCGICPILTHPSRGFLNGLCNNESRILRSHTQGLARRC